VKLANIIQVNDSVELMRKTNQEYSPVSFFSFSVNITLLRTTMIRNQIHLRTAANRFLHGPELPDLEEEDLYVVVLVRTPLEKPEGEL